MPAALRMALRGLAIVAIFLSVVPAHLATALLGKRDVVPPLFLRWMGRACGLQVRCVGKPRPGALFLANHVSWLDILALAGASRSMFVAHAGLSTNPALKWLCAQNFTVFITRDRRGSVAKQVQQVRDALHHHRPLTIFPEATTNDGTALLPFRSSLLSAVEPLAHEVPVQPVALEYHDAAGIAWVGAEPGLANFRRIVRRKGRIGLTIHFLEPLAGDALRDRKTMTAAAQSAVATALRL